MTQIAPASAETIRTATEPRRLQILELIWDRERSVNDIASRLPVSVAAVSQHLSKLRAAGLVSVRADGRQRFYRATKEDLGALAVVLESFWKDRLSALKRLAESVGRESGPQSSTDRGGPEEKGRER